MKEQHRREEVQPTGEAAGSRLLDEMIERSGAPHHTAAGATTVIGTVAATTPKLCVTWDEQLEPTQARSTVVVRSTDVGREVTLVFERGDATRPIVTGLLQPDSAAEPPSVGVEVDGQDLVLEGREQVVLRCGKASITLTRAGKVLVQGAYVSSRSTGIYRILGGSVEIN